MHYISAKGMQLVKETLIRSRAQRRCIDYLVNRIQVKNKSISCFERLETGRRYAIN
jgi:hypothetical protein